MQNDKVGKVVVKYEAAIKEVDIRLSVSGGDSGSKGPKQQKTEITIYTLRNGVVCFCIAANHMISHYCLCIMTQSCCLLRL